MGAKSSKKGKHGTSARDFAKSNGHAKSHLPSKICPTCHRPFTWRKKWANDWDNVVYCSKRCRP